MYNHLPAWLQGPGDVLGFAADGTAGESGNQATVSRVLDAFTAFRDNIRALAKQKAGQQEFMAVCERAQAELSVAVGVTLETRLLDAFGSFKSSVEQLVASQAPLKDVLAACDSVRDDTCVDLGVRLEDKPDGEC